MSLPGGIPDRPHPGVESRGEIPGHPPARAPRRNGLRRPLIVSLAVHVSFLFTVTVLARPRFTVPKKMDAIPIDVVAGLPAPPHAQMKRVEPAVARPSVPVPQPKKSVKPPAPKKEKEEAKRPVLEHPAPGRTKQPARQEAPAPALPKRGRADTTQVLSTQLPAIGDMKGAMQIQVEGEVLPYSYYLAVVQQKIASYWDPPPDLGGNEVAVVVWFRIERDGSIKTSYIEEPSGSTVFDTSALRALERSAPLPPLPVEYPGDHLIIHLRFVYSP